MRKLATVQRIKKLTPIEGSDFIELARIRGWNVVVKKNEFKEGDLVVYCEIDSVLPDVAEFQFLKDKKFRIKTIKLRGQISQGIAFHLSVLKETNVGELYEDTDVTEALGVVKYEIQEKIDNNVIVSEYPSFLQRTDEERVQNSYTFLTESVEKKYPFVVTEKLDGTSSTYYLYDDEYGVCSRNQRIKTIDGVETNNKYITIGKKYDIESRLKEYYNKHKIYLCLQGEIIGSGVQSNLYNIVNDNKLYIFNVSDIGNHVFFSYDKVIDIISELNSYSTFPNLELVPFIETLDCLLTEDVDYYVEKSKNNSKVNPKIKAEGVVYKVNLDLKIKKSFKSINPEFLLKYDN